jgi:hypothetical protein
MIAIRYVIYLVLLFPDYIALLSIIFINVVLYVWYVHFRNILFPVHLFTFMNIDYMCSMYISGGGGTYRYLFSSRETDSWCAECAVRCVHMC